MKYCTMILLPSSNKCQMIMNNSKGMSELFSNYTHISRHNSPLVITLMCPLFGMSKILEPCIIPYLVPTPSSPHKYTKQYSIVI